MILFDEEYKLILGFYLFEKKSLEDKKVITIFTRKLCEFTHIERSVTQIEYILSCYKNVDPKFSALVIKENENFKYYLEIYQSEKAYKELKELYNRFKNYKHEEKKEKAIFNNTYIKDKPVPKKEIITEIISSYPRDESKKINAMYLAGFKCEISSNHESFLTQEGIPYLEGHHLVPLRYQRMFNKSLDVEANIVCLCANCHREIHYGKNSSQLVKLLLNKRVNRLKECEIEINTSELLKMYER